MGGQGSTVAWLQNVCEAAAHVRLWRREPGGEMPDTRFDMADRAVADTIACVSFERDGRETSESTTSRRRNAGKASRLVKNGEVGLPARLYNHRAGSTDAEPARVTRIGEGPDGLEVDYRGCGPRTARVLAFAIATSRLTTAGHAMKGYRESPGGRPSLRGAYRESPAFTHRHRCRPPHGR
jgi:hypothetical protein